MVSFKLLGALALTSAATAQAAKSTATDRMTIVRSHMGLENGQSCANFEMRPSNGLPEDDKKFKAAGTVQSTDIAPFEYQVLPGSGNDTCAQVNLRPLSENKLGARQFVRYECSKKGNSTLSIFASMDDCLANNLESNMTETRIVVNKMVYCRGSETADDTSKFLEQYFCEPPATGAETAQVGLTAARYTIGKSGWMHMSQPKVGHSNEKECDNCKSIAQILDEDMNSEGIFYHHTPLPEKGDLELFQTLAFPHKELWNVCRPVQKVVEGEATTLFYRPSISADGEGLLTPVNGTFFSDEDCEERVEDGADCEFPMCMWRDVNGLATTLLKEDGRCFDNVMTTEKILINPEAIRGAYVGATHLTCATPLSIEFPVIFLAIFIVLFIMTFVLIYVYVRTRRAVWAEAEEELLGRTEDEE